MTDYILPPNVLSVSELARTHKSDQSIYFRSLSYQRSNLHPKTVCSPPVPFRPPPCESYHSELISILILVEIDQAYQAHKQDNLHPIHSLRYPYQITILPGNIEQIKNATLAQRGRLTSYIPHVRQTKR
jgi:hypothetical protein